MGMVSTHVPCIHAMLKSCSALTWLTGSVIMQYRAVSARSLPVFVSCLRTVRPSSFPRGTLAPFYLDQHIDVFSAFWRSSLQCGSLPLSH